MASLQHGEPKTVVQTTALCCGKWRSTQKKPAQYAREIEAILNGTTVPQEETVSVFYEAHPRDEQVEALIIFDDAPVAKRDGMSVVLGQSLGQAEQSARQSIERAQTSAMARISRTPGLRGPG